MSDLAFRTMKKLTIKIPQDRGHLYDVIRYPAGEIQVRLTEAGLKACQGRDSYEVICNPIPDVIELAQLKDALECAETLARPGWWERRLFLPYMPYARADRRFVKGDCHGLRVWSRLIESLGFSSIWTFDVHSEVSKAYFPGLANMKPDDYGCDQLAGVIKKLGRKGLVFVSPDSGSRYRYCLSSHYDLPVIQGIKRRDATTGKLSGFDVLNEKPPAGHCGLKAARKALIVDDICDGGGTFIGLAEALHKINKGLELYLYVSHGIFSKGTDELLKHFRQLFVSEYGINRQEIKAPCDAKKFIFEAPLKRADHRRD